MGWLSVQPLPCPKPRLAPSLRAGEAGAEGGSPGPGRAVSSQALGDLGHLDSPGRGLVGFPTPLLPHPPAFCLPHPLTAVWRQNSPWHQSKRTDHGSLLVCVGAARMGRRASVDHRWTETSRDPARPMLRVPSCLPAPPSTIHPYFHSSTQLPTPLWSAGPHSEPRGWNGQKPVSPCSFHLSQECVRDRGKGLRPARAWNRVSAHRYLLNE